MQICPLRIRYVDIGLMHVFKIHSKQVFDVHITGIVHLRWAGESQRSSRKDFLYTVLIGVFVKDAGVIAFEIASIREFRRIHAADSSICAGTRSGLGMSIVTNSGRLRFSASAHPSPQPAPRSP